MKQRQNQEDDAIQTFLTSDQVLSFLRKSAQLNRQIKADPRKDQEPTRWALSEAMASEIDNQPGSTRAMLTFQALLGLGLEEMHQRFREDPKFKLGVLRIADKLRQFSDVLKTQRKKVIMVVPHQEQIELSLMKACSELALQLKSEWTAKKSLEKRGLTPGMRQVLASLMQKLTSQGERVPAALITNSKVVQGCLSKIRAEGERLQQEQKKLRATLDETARVLQQLERNLVGLKKTLYQKASPM